MTEPGIDIAFCWDFEDCSPEDGLARLRASQFEGIELWPRWINAFGIDAWAAALQSHGMRCFQLCPYFDFVHGPEALAASREELERFLDYARIVGCTRLRAFTGPVPPNERAVGMHQADDAQWDAAIAGLREFCDRAAGQGVELCLECHEGMLMEGSEGALGLLHGADRPNLTTNLQIPLEDEDWQTTIDRLGKYTSHIHIHNWHGPMIMDNLTFLSDGEFDWQPVVRTLVREYGRRICLSIEHPRHNERDSSWETARRDGPFLAALRAAIMTQ
jgi:sugar phosphate isomerase/epimerase